jgi:hypothetical protein
VAERDIIFILDSGFRICGLVMDFLILRHSARAESRFQSKIANPKSKIRWMNESSFSFAKGITKPENKSTKICKFNVFFCQEKKKDWLATNPKSEN